MFGHAHARHVPEICNFDANERWQLDYVAISH